MSIIIRLQNLPWSASSVDIRTFFVGLSIPVGGVHIVGGELGEAFIVFSTDEDARLAMERNGGSIKDMKIKLLLSSRTEMARVIEQARSQSSQVLPPNIPVAMKVAAMNDSDRRPTEERRLAREKKLMSVKEYERSRSRSPAPPTSQFDHQKQEIRTSGGSPIPRDVNYGIPRSAVTPEEQLHERKYLSGREVPKSLEMHPGSELHPRVASTPGLTYRPKQADGGSIPQDYGRVQTQRVSEAPYLFPAAMHSAALKTEAKMVVEQPRLPNSFVTTSRYPAYDNVPTPRERPPPVPTAADMDVGLVPALSRNRRPPTIEYEVPDDEAAYPRVYEQAPSASSVPPHDVQNPRMMISRAQRNPEPDQYFHDPESLARNQINAYQPSASKRVLAAEPEDQEMRYYEGRSTAVGNRLEAPPPPRRSQPEPGRAYPVAAAQPNARQSRFQPEQDVVVGGMDRQQDRRAYFPSVDDNRYKPAAVAYPEDADFEYKDAAGYDGGGEIPRKVPRRPVQDPYESEEAHWPQQPVVSAPPAWSEGRRGGYQERSVPKHEGMDDYTEEPMDIEMPQVAAHHPMPSPTGQGRPQEPYYQKHDNEPVGGYDTYQTRNRGGGEPVMDERRMGRPESRAVESRPFPMRKRGYDNEHDDSSDRQLVRRPRNTPAVDQGAENRLRPRNFPSTRWGPERESSATRERFPNMGSRGPEMDDRSASSSAAENPVGKQFNPPRRWEPAGQSNKPADMPQNPSFRGHPREQDSRRFDQYQKRDPIGQKPEPPYKMLNRTDNLQNREQRREASRQPEPPNRPSFPPRRENNAPSSVRHQDKPRRDQLAAEEEPQNRRSPPQLTVEVRGLPEDAREDDLRELFREIIIPSNHLRLARDAEGRTTGTGFVKFKDHRDYEAGLRRSGRDIGNCFPEVKPCPLSAFEKCPVSSSVPIRKFETAPPQNRAAPPQTRATPPQTRAAPPQTRAAPPQTRATPPQTRAAPPQTRSAAVPASVKDKNPDEQKIEPGSQVQVEKSESNVSSEKKEDATKSVPATDAKATSGGSTTSAAVQSRSTAPRQDRESTDNDLCVEIKGLPYACTENGIADFFSGLHILDLYLDKLPDGRAAGIAYVEFATPADFQAALDMNGNKFNHRFVTVLKASREVMKRMSQKKKPALLETPTIPSATDQKICPPPDNTPINDGPTFCASVEGVPKHATNYDLEAFFAEVDVVPLAIHVMKGPDKLPSGKAFVEFQERDLLEKSLVKNGKPIRGSRISVRPVSYQEMCTCLGGRPNTVLPPTIAQAPNAGPPLQPASRRGPIPPSDPGNPNGPRDRFPPRQNRPPMGGPPGMRPRMGPGMRPIRPDGPRGPPPPRGNMNRMGGPPPPMNGGGDPMFQRPRSRFGRPPGPPEQTVDPVDFGAPGCVVSVSNLHFRAGIEDILQFFSNFTLSSQNVLRKYTNDGKPTGDARIAFSNRGEALRAINELNRRPIFDRPVFLSVI